MISLPSIIDVEASGFGHDSYPIEVGIAHSSGKRFCSLIKPSPAWTYWDKDAEQIHKISRQTLGNKGRSIQEVAHLLNQNYAGQTLYSDGWVVDKPWLSMLFYATRMPMKFSVSPLEMILNEEQMQYWHEVKDRVIQESGLARHRASNDAYIIQKTFEQTRLLEAALRM